MAEQQRVPELEKYYGLPIVRERAQLQGATPQYWMFICYEEGNKTNGHVYDACLEFVKSKVPSPRPSCPRHPGRTGMGAMSRSGQVYRLRNGSLVRYSV